MDLIIGLAFVSTLTLFSGILYFRNHSSTKKTKLCSYKVRSKKVKKS